MEGELTGLGDEFAVGVLVRERGESWVTQGFDSSNGVDAATIYDMG